MKPRGFARSPLVLAMALLCVPLAQAATRTWNCSDGYWEDASCWLPSSGLPGAGDDVILNAVGGGDTNLQFDDVTGSRTVKSLTIRTLGSASVTFAQRGGSLSTSTTTIESGAWWRQNGPLGSLHRSKSLTVGGNYELGYANTLQIDGRTLIGGSEGGSISNASGSFSTVDLDLGSLAGRGRYVTSGGGLSATQVRVGYQSEGNFLQIDGSTQAKTLTLGLGGPGYVSLWGGTLAAETVVVSHATPASFGQQGGIHTVNTLVLGQHAGSDGTYKLTGGTLSTVSVNVGNLGTGSFAHSAGVHLVDDNLRIGGSGSYQLSGTGELRLAGNSSIDNEGSFVQTGGRFVGTLVNRGSFVYGAAGGAAPAFAARLVNEGTVTLAVSGSFADGMQNNGSFTELVAGRSLALDGSGLENNGSIVMAGGTLQGSGALLNNGNVSGHGRIGGSGGFFNYGVVTPGASPLVLANTGGNLNAGTWWVPAASEVQLAGAGITLSNQGVLALQGGRVSGSGTLSNGAGGLVSGSGGIASRFVNAGTLALADGNRIVVSSSFANSGLIDLGGSSALLSGTTLANTGLVAGRGRIANAVDNRAGGRIQADGGVLVLAGSVGNAGMLVAEAGGTLLLQAPLASQIGTLQLNGGTIDNAGWTLRNDGIVGGHGTLRAAAIQNAGQMQFSAGSTQIHGALSNLDGGRILVSGTGVATFYGSLQARAGSELRVAAGSAAVFFGPVNQASGALFTGEGTRYFEGGLSLGGTPALGGSQGSVVFGSANLYRAEIGGLEAGSGHDQFAVGGRLDFGGTLQLAWWGGFEAQAGQRFDLFDWGSANGTFAAIDLGAAALDPGLQWDTSRLYLDGSIGVVAVPEPGPWALMLGGAAAILIRRRAGSRRDSPRSGAGWDAARD